jgi:hypothetical protein
MIKITMSDLVQTLRKAAAHPERHASAQLKYFSPIKEDSVLVNCGSACCVAGDLMLKAHADEPKRKLNDIIEKWNVKVDPWSWVTKELGLTGLESELAFDSNTHYRVHLVLADLLEAGLRLEYRGGVEMSAMSTYTHFDWASPGDDEGRCMNLEEFLEWMRAIAK